MSKISRADSKARFRTGMYPTQADFENLHDSYVHKDDTIPLEQVGTNGATVVSLLNQKANSSHTHEIKDVDGLEKFITEMTSLLEIVRDPETGEISQSKLKTLTAGIAALRDDIDTNTDNIAGHETRINNNTAALEKVYQILGKDAKESIDDLANRFAALSGNYANVYAFINKVKQFLEDADASDETINRWQEIEAFLQGVTDTQTLTGLLEQQRTDLEGRIAEAIAAIPKGNYLKLVPDLDAYTDAPDGEIVKYTGPTNDKYTRGWDYERVAGDGQPVEFMVPAGTPTINRIFVPESAPDNYKQFISNAKFPFKREGSFSEFTTFRASNGSVEVLFLFSNHPSVGDLVFLREDFAPHFITEVDSASFKTDIDDYSWSLSSIEPEPATAYVNVDGLRIVLDDDFERFNTPSTETDINSPVIIPDQRLYFWGDRENHVFMEKKSADQTYSYPGGSPASWQLSPSMPVIQ